MGLARGSKYIFQFSDGNHQKNAGIIRSNKVPSLTV